MVTSTLVDHLEKLRYFVDIAECGSMAKAATKLRLSQPTLTHTIKVLEKVLGTKLFLRTSHGMELTDSGNSLYEYGKKLLNETALVEQELHLKDDSQIKEIELGTKEPFAVYQWPLYLKQMEILYPAIDVNLHIKRTNTELIEHLKAQKFDMLMIPDPPESEDIISYEVFRESFGVYQAKAIKKSSKPRPLYLFRYALAGGGQTIDSVLKRQSFSKENIRDVDSFSVAKAMALHGLGTALLPKNVAEGLVEVESSVIHPEIFGSLQICLCILAKNQNNKKLRGVICAIKHLHHEAFPQSSNVSH